MALCKSSQLLLLNMKSNAAINCRLCQGQPFLWPHYQVPAWGIGKRFWWWLTCAFCSLKYTLVISLWFLWSSSPHLWFWRTGSLALYPFRRMCSERGFVAFSENHSKFGCFLSFVGWICSFYRMSLSCSCHSGHPLLCCCSSMLLVQASPTFLSLWVSCQVGRSVFQHPFLFGDPWCNFSSLSISSWLEKWRLLNHG